MTQSLRNLNSRTFTKNQDFPSKPGKTPDNPLIKMKGNFPKTQGYLP